MKNRIATGLICLATISALSLVLLSQLKSHSVKKANANQMDLVTCLCNGTTTDDVRSFIRNDFEYLFQFKDVTFEGDCITIAPGGYIRNITAYNGLQSITFDNTFENLAVSAGKLTANGIERYHYYAKDYDASKLAETYSFIERTSSHFVLQDIDETNPVVINSMALNYSCNGTIETPTIASLEGAYDNYTWYFKGGGTETTPFLIQSDDDWTAFTVTYQKNYTGFHFKLTNNIVATSANLKDFKGHFNGDGHKITANLSGNTSGFGLFSTIGGVGTIENLTVEGTITSSSTDVGAIVGMMGDTRNRIVNCVNRASISGKFTFGFGVGGIVGRAKAGSIINCVNESSNIEATGATNLTSGVCVGGILGSSYLSSGGASTTVKDCKNFGNLTTTNSYIGGIVGFANKSTIVIENCQNGDETHHPVITGYQQVAGILGSANSGCDQDNSLIKGCKNYGTIKSSATSGHNSGGIAGQSVVPIINCDNYGEVVEITNGTHPTLIMGNGTLGWVVGKAVNAGATGSSNNNNYFVV